MTVLYIRTVRVLWASHTTGPTQTFGWVGEDKQTQALHRAIGASTMRECSTKGKLASVPQKANWSAQSVLTEHTKSMRPFRGFIRGFICSVIA